MASPTRTDPRLAVDESRRAVQHESIKATVEDDVNAQIAEQAQQRARGSEAEIQRVAQTMREHAVHEVADSERELQRSRGVARVSQIIDYAFFVLYALLAFRFVLALIAARSSAGFVRFIVSVTEPFYAPFKAIVASPRTGDGHTLLLPIIVAIVAYAVLHLAINRLLRLFVHRKTAV